MQLLLPIFPQDTRMVSDRLGVNLKEGLVQYIVNGMPVYCHPTSDLNAFRFITSNFVHQGIFRKVDIQRVFNVSEDSVSRSYKKFIEEGATGFFGADARKGKAHKLTGELRARVQSKLDKGQSNYSIAKEEGIAESAIRYGIKLGYLIKKK
jgi:hypothetical protein